MATSGHLYPILISILMLATGSLGTHHLDRFSSKPWDRISFVDVSEPNTADPPPNQIKSSMDDVEASIKTVQNMMDQVQQQVYF